MEAATMKPVRGVIEEADIKLGSLMYNQGKEHTTDIAVIKARASITKEVEQ